MSETEEIVVGDLKIAGNVLTKMVRESAGAVAGVSAVKDVAIAPGETSLNIDITLNVGYKTIYPDTAADVQRAVIDDISRMTGVKVDEVNVMVDRLDFSKE
jgi:uncharacterized alkaline shock family protein YloU